ncbi:MAG: HD-GYP domain-containing protein [Acidimicrobiia bacterium]
MQRLERKKVRLAVLYASAGVACLVGLAFWQEFPPLSVWIPFAAAFAFLEWRSVEVNERLKASPAVMVALVAGVVFGHGSAALGMAALGALGMFNQRDVKERRVLVPMMNFGQYVVTETVAGLVLEPFLSSTGTWDTADVALAAVGAALAAGMHAAVNLGLVAYAVRMLYADRRMRPWSGLGELVPSHIVMGALGGLLGATYHLEPTILPLIFVVFVIGYLSFASYGELREAHEATLRGFIKALEAKDLYTRGHTERVAYFTQIIGKELRFSGTRIEQLRWAALIHDVGKLAVPRELIRKKGRLTPAEYGEMQRHAQVVEEILAEVEFLRPMVEIASGHHAHFNGEGYGGTGHTEGEIPSPEARILAVADAFDAMTSTRTYRMALTQEYAIAELRSHAGTQFDPEVVEALESALAKTGERYGSPNLDDETRARRLAEIRKSVPGWTAGVAARSDGAEQA